MAKDWASDVKTFVPDADDGVIAGIVRYCGIALQKPDSSLVSYTDPVELGRVRNNFLKKKLGLTDPDEVLDAAIAAVGERMKGVNFKNRVTVYYLLLDHLNLLDRFRKPGAAAKAAAPAPAGPDPAAPVAVAGLVAAGAAATSATAEAAPPVVEPVAAPVGMATSVAEPADSPIVETVAAGDVAPPAAAGAAAAPAARTLTSAPLGAMAPGYRLAESDGKGIGGFLLAAVLGTLAIIGLFLLLPHHHQKSDVAETVMAPAAGPAVAPVATGAAAPATTPVAVPDGAGIVSETREAKPVVKVYFDTGKADVAPTFALATEPLKAWLTTNPGSILAVSGYNDPTGNAAANAALSKRRAQAVQAALVAAGVPAGSIELVKPAAATDTAAASAEARRVEVYVK